MSIMNIFTQDAFSVMRLTDALREISYVPSLIGQMNLFQTVSIDTLDIAIEKDKEQNRMLVSASPRGGPGQTFDKSKRAMRLLKIPHFQVGTTIEMSRPLDALATLNETRTAADRVLPAALFVRAAGLAAAQVTGVNGWWRDGAFVPAPDVHVGVVIALRRGGLLVPVVRNADRKDLDTVMAEFRDLVTRARAGRLRASEMGGATITITQLGEGEVDTVVPIIHPPQVAILGLGAVHDAPWVDHGTLVVRPVVRATLAADHRAVDGRIGSAFLVALDRRLQEVCS